MDFYGKMTLIDPVFRCERNYLDIHDGSELWTQIQTFIERDGTAADFDHQKMKENFVLNASDVATLAQFANQGDNLSKLGWNLSRPETWQGIQWIYANGSYHVQGISISNLELTGNLNLSGMEQLIRVACDNNNLTSIDVSGCERLWGLSSISAGIRNLNISNTPSLTILKCDDNYLNISDIINDINIVKTRENAWVSYAEQRLLYNLTITTPGLSYDETSKTLTFDTIRLVAHGVLPESVLVEVNKFDTSNEQTHIGANTITLNASGVGIYWFTGLPIVIDAADKHVVISVYTDESRVRLVSRLLIKPTLFDF